MRNRRGISAENFTNNKAVYTMSTRYVQLSHFGLVEHESDRDDQFRRLEKRRDSFDRFVSSLCMWRRDASRRLAGPTQHAKRRPKKKKPEPERIGYGSCRGATHIVTSMYIHTCCVPLLHIRIQFLHECYALPRNSLNRAFSRRLFKRQCLRYYHRCPSLV